MKSLVFSAILAFFCLNAANAKSYEILVASPTKVGGVELAPGQYRMSVEGESAVFKDVRTAREFVTAVKVENTGTSYGVTRINTTRGFGVQRIEAIELEGSGLRVEFAN